MIEARPTGTSWRIMCFWRATFKNLVTSGGTKILSRRTSSGLIPRPPILHSPVSTTLHSLYHEPLIHHVIVVLQSSMDDIVALSGPAFLWLAIVVVGDGGSSRKCSAKAQATVTRSSSRQCCATEMVIISFLVITCSFNGSGRTNR
jgi:hypothetical protein